MSTDLISAATVELARLIRNRKVSSLEVVDAHLARIDAVNPRINAVIQLASDARERAHVADAALARREVLGPLHGVPFTVKDWIEAEGLPCAGGFAERRDYTPKADATVVARMREAGAILLGKTTVGFDGAPYQQPNNPHDLTRMPGGSSSGEAAIIAAGGSPLGIASDSGGSIRWPAHCCGVPSLKPTTGRIPLTGHFPRITVFADPRTAIGPLARSVDDLALALQIVAGPDGRDPSVVPVPFVDPASISIAGMRIAWFTRITGANPTLETIAAVDSAARVLSKAGATVTESKPPRLEESLPITLEYWARADSMSLNRWLPSRETQMSGDDIQRHFFEWDRFRRTMLMYMQDFDAVISPVASAPAPPHGDVPNETWLYTLPWSLTGYPAVTVPVAKSHEGLPMSLQIIAASWNEHITLAIAKHLELTFGGWRRAEVP